MKPGQLSYRLAWGAFILRLIIQTLDITGVLRRDGWAAQTDLGVLACFFMLLAIWERRASVVVEAHSTDVVIHDERARPSSTGGKET